MKFPTKEKVAEVAREVALRRNSYPWQVSSGRLASRDADSRIALMVEIQTVDLPIAEAALAYVETLLRDGPGWSAEVAEGALVDAVANAGVS